MSDEGGKSGPVKVVTLSRIKTKLFFPKNKTLNSATLKLYEKCSVKRKDNLLSCES